MRTVAVLISLALAAPLAAEPSLVADLNTGPNTEQPRVVLPSAAGGEIAYFSASDPAHGMELWRTDGTPGGTWRVTDICPGPCDAEPKWLAVFRGRVFFGADDGVSGRELWQSDGTPGNERRVSDLCAGPCHGDPAGLAVLGNRLLFIGSAGQDRSVWSSNGTRQGTVPLKEVCTFSTPDPPADSDCPWFPGLEKIGGFVYFGLLRPEGGFELWRSDGTAAGTRLLPALTSRGVVISDDQLIWQVGNAGFVWTWDGLWRTDGTGSVRIKSMAELTADGSTSSYPFRTAIWNGLLFTVLEDGELIRSDGTRKGTFRIGKFRWGYDVLELTPSAAGLLFMVTTDGPQKGLWRTKGTAATTKRLPGIAEGRSLALLTPLGGTVVFVGQRPEGGPAELWKTDGTPTGTSRILKNAGTLQSYSTISTAGKRAFFLRGTGDLLPELWTTGGTKESTAFLRDFNDVPASSGPLDQIVFDGRLVFSAQISREEAPLFESDGTPGGTRELSRDASWARFFLPVGDRLYFPAMTNFQTGLWWLDRNSDLTVKSGVGGFSAPMMSLGSTVLFRSSIESAFGRADVELFRSDGTVNGTGLLKNINTASIYTGFHHTCVGDSSDPGPGIEINGRLVFAAQNDRDGRELWETDGTADGTRMLLDINPGRVPWDGDECDDRTDNGLSSNPGEFLAFHGGALFAADDGTTGRELWWTDGTAAGTRRVHDLVPGPVGSEPHELVAFKGEVYFFARRAGAAGEALWRTDGTAAGTVLVDDLAVAGTPSWPRELKVAGERLFFSAYNESTGAELWTSLGDAASTGLVADLRPGAPSSAPQALTAVDGLLVFAADDGEHGLEPWRSDGTAEGTRRLADISPGRGSSSPGPFSLVGTHLLTGADDGEHGRELWTIPVGDVIDP